MADLELVLATLNPGKLQEMRKLAEGLPFRILGLREVGVHEAPAETGATFLANAALKAVHYSKATGRVAIADDSGLSVDALDGGPGLYSARFGGERASDAERNQLLLEKLKGVPRERRGARFTSAVVVAAGEEILFETLQSVEGFVAEEPRGSGGFGYDPLFFYPPFGTTFGEAARADKDRVSHRGQSFAHLKEWLASEGGVRTLESAARRLAAA